MDKKNSDRMFDVTMGSYNGAETCELIGAYMLSLLAPKLKHEVGLYVTTASPYVEPHPEKLKRLSKKSATHS